jgi:hypothetical protein
MAKNIGVNIYITEHLFYTGTCFALLMMKLRLQKFTVL